MPFLSTAIMYGTHAARPAASLVTAGRLYWETDTLRMFRVSDDGTTWNDVSGNPMTTAEDLIVGGTSGTATRKAKGSNGDVLTVVGGVLTWQAPATSGTVTSVAMTVPSILSVSGSPITSSGTLAVTLANETANTILAGPTSGGAAAPTFRGLVTADMPAGTGTVTSVAQTVPAEFSVAGSPITSSGTLAISKANQSANTHWSGPTSGGAAAPAFRALVAADLTGVPMSASGDIIYGGASGLPTRLAKGSDGQALTLSGGIPAWANYEPWRKTGASVLVGAYGDGNPATMLSVTVATLSPSGLGQTIARAVQFRLPFNLALTHLYTFGRNTVTGACVLGIYPDPAGSSKTWDSGNVDLTASTWVDITGAGTPALNTVTLSANTDYWMCLTTTSSSGTAALQVLSLAGALMHGAGPLTGGAAIGLPVQMNFGVTAGALPGTLPSLSAPSATTQYGPMVWLLGTAS